MALEVDYQKGTMSPPTTLETTSSGLGPNLSAKPINIPFNDNTVPQPSETLPQKTAVKPTKATDRHKESQRGA